MQQKTKEKELAVKLRKEGKTYNEILEVVPVAKSTLSLWLREVGLSKVQKQTITAKKRAAQLRGGRRRREMRLEEEEVMLKRALKEINTISDHDLFLIGIALYWAEGAKPKESNPSVMVDFANSDPGMLKLFIKWLYVFGDVGKEDIKLRLHLHNNHSKREETLKKLWSDNLGIPMNQFVKTNFKQHNPKTKRVNSGDDYIGLVSVRVLKSTTLNRRIMGWIYAIIATQK